MFDHDLVLFDIVHSVHAGALPYSQRRYPFETSEWCLGLLLSRTDEAVCLRQMEE